MRQSSRDRDPEYQARRAEQRAESERRYQENDARRAQQRKEALKRLEPDIRMLERNGLLRKLDLSLGQAYVEPVMWHALSIDAKQGVAGTLAAYRDAKGEGSRLAIMDWRSGKKLASYSPSWGFSVE